MELAATHRAQTLEGATSLDDVIDRVRAEAPRHRDHSDIHLRDTRLMEDGEWRYNGSAGRLSRHALGQLCSRIRVDNGPSVPSGYLARCPAPLAAENLNHWIAQLPATESPKVFVRTKEEGERETVRAVLSERYAVADHVDLLESLHALLPVHRLHLSAWSLDDEQLTLRLQLDSDHPATLADPLRVGLHLRNSEVGLGRVSVQGLVTRLVCDNGLVVNVAEFRGIHRRHVGRAGESLKPLIREGLPRVLEEAGEAARRFVRLRGEPAPEPLETFLERTVRAADLPEAVLPKVRHFLEGETMYDVVNAFTRAAQAFPVADRLEIETAMGRFLRPQPDRSP